MSEVVLAALVTGLLGVLGSMILASNRIRDLKDDKRHLETENRELLRQIQLLEKSTLIATKPTRVSLKENHASNGTSLISSLPKYENPLELTWYFIYILIIFVAVICTLFVSIKLFYLFCVAGLVLFAYLTWYKFAPTGYVYLPMPITLEPHICDKQLIPNGDHDEQLALHELFFGNRNMQDFSVFFKCSGEFIVISSLTGNQQTGGWSEQQADDEVIIDLGKYNLRITEVVLATNGKSGRFTYLKNEHNLYFHFHIGSLRHQ